MMKSEHRSKAGQVERGSADIEANNGGSLPPHNPQNAESNFFIRGVTIALVVAVLLGGAWYLKIKYSPPNYDSARTSIRQRVSKQIANLHKSEQLEIQGLLTRNGQGLEKAVTVLQTDVKANGEPNKVTVLQYFDAGYTRQLLGGVLTYLNPWTLLFSKNGMMDKYEGLYHESGSIKQCLVFLSQMELRDTHGVQILVHRDGLPTPLLSGSGKTIRDILSGSFVRHGSAPRDSDSAETRAKKLRTRDEQKLYYELDGSIVLPKPENI